jgi:hypothetical protein
MKKMRIIIIVAVIIFTSELCKAQEVNENWINMDSVFISQVKNAYINNPLSIENYLEPWEVKRIKL